MKKESKIILVSGVAITFKEEDKVYMMQDDGSVVEIDIRDIPRYVMEKTGDIIIHHEISTGEYMEYYLTREKITWAYYSEEPEEKQEE